MRDETHPAHILIVEDEADFAESLKRELREEFELVDSVTTCVDAISRIRRSASFYDVIIMDQNLGVESDGLECMREIKRTNSSLEVIILTGYGERDLAVQALKDGAFRYIYKPPNFDEMIASIYAAHSLVHLRSVNSQLAREGHELRTGALKLLIISGIALISILTIAVTVRDIFLPAAIAFFAILCILFAGWQGLAKVLFKWGSKKETASLTIETIHPALEKRKMGKRGESINK